MPQAEERPFAPACEKNQQPILEVLQTLLKDNDRVFEIGSGTGQHALYFSDAFPTINWTTSDHVDYHAGIKQWIADSKHQNIQGPFEYQATHHPLPVTDQNILFSANTLHIMGKEEGLQLFKDLGNAPSLKSLVFYGPFNYNGEFTSEGNANFEIWLKERNPKSGIRDFEWVQSELANYEFSLSKDFEMPANNRILHFQR
jgi:hypothetical protein